MSSSGAKKAVHVKVRIIYCNALNTFCEFEDRRLQSISVIMTMCVKQNLLSGGLFGSSHDPGGRLHSSVFIALSGGAHN
jgi:hypothetical protein